MRGRPYILLPVILPLLLAAEPTTAPLSPARAAFERFKALDGQWIGRSTKGWEERSTVRVIAGGSCVMQTSFDAHPNETMVTMFHMDGPDLILTHYCVAKNQPRLKATKFGEDGMTVTFTFMDATNLPSRDAGHMDQAVFTLESPDRYTSQWTWYQNGQERWMERIENVRASGSDNATGKPAVTTAPSR